LDFNAVGGAQVGLALEDGIVLAEGDLEGGGAGEAG
jgi:hypothetical protein